MHDHSAWEALCCPLPLVVIVYISRFSAFDHIMILIFSEKEVQPPSERTCNLGILFWDQSGISCTFKTLIKLTLNFSCSRNSGSDSPGHTGWVYSIFLVKMPCILFRWIIWRERHILCGTEVCGQNLFFHFCIHFICSFMRIQCGQG